MDILQKIQMQQFSERSEAETLLLSFIRSTFPLDVQKVELRPLAVSLNSFNGFLTLADGKRLFFKTHTEQDNVIGEYYNARMLADAGYPVIQPLYSSTAAGQHLLIYEVIESPSVFDLAWSIEQGENPDALPALIKAQNDADDQLLQCYLNSMELQSADDAAKAPVHQLFYHRLAGGRLERFYGVFPGKSNEVKTILLPDRSYHLEELLDARWIINGQQYNESLDDIIMQAFTILNPLQSGISVVGHGDAHNGNVFFQSDNTGEPSLLYFDPAFAGRHHPLLDLTKPLFHNVFAMWMYFPEVKRAKTSITLDKRQDTWQVEHDYALPNLRLMFLESKVNRALIPILKELKIRGLLRNDWRGYLKAALFCCPFLTLNLADPDRFSPEISLLGMTMAIEMGSESMGKRSLIDQTLDEVEQAL